MKPIVIIVNGYPRSGKDTFCEFAGRKYNCVYYSTVDTVKVLATDMGWNGEKTPVNRAMLSALKDFYVKWFDGTFSEITSLITYEVNHSDEFRNDLIFLHTREPEEIERVVNWCDESNIECYTVCIRRKETEGTQSNHADNNIDKYIYNVYIGNDRSIEEFEILSLDFFEGVLSGKMEEYMSWR